MLRSAVTKPDMKHSNTHLYDDIIHLPHHSSPTRPRMSMEERAAQFAPFAALTGHDAAVAEAGRRTEERIELAPDSRAELDAVLQQLKAMPVQPVVTITYFRADERKTGGAYLTRSTRLRNIDPVQHTVTLEYGEVVGMEDVLEVTL